jgi:hypothetical protein
MSSSPLVLTPLQQSFLRRLAQTIIAMEHTGSAMIMLLIVMVVLETLNVEPHAIADIFGAEVTNLLDTTLEAGVQLAPRPPASRKPTSRKLVSRKLVSRKPISQPAAARVRFHAAARDWREERSHGQL